MSELVEIEVLHRSGATWIFQRPDRGYPSISIQGDALMLLATRSKNVLDQLRNGTIDQWTDVELEYVSDMLNGLRAVYEKHGLVEGGVFALDQTQREEK